MRSLSSLFFVISFLHVLNVYSFKSDLLPNTDICGISKVGANSNDIAETSLNEFPWLVLLKYKDTNGEGGGFYCGGVLINNRYVLTGTPCVHRSHNWNLISVRLGEYNTETNPDCTGEMCAPSVVDIPVAETILHEAYSNKNRHHDIALIRLEQKVDFNEWIKPICLPDKWTNKNFTGSNLIVSGWATTPHSQEANVKKKLSVPAYSNENCAKIYEQFKYAIGEDQLCAGGVKERDLCYGAGGTSLITKKQDGSKSNWYAAGIVSFGISECGTENVPSIYTRVSKYIPWIVSKLQE